MSPISTFVDAFKKAAGKEPAKPDIDFKTYGPLGSTTQEGGKSFTPLWPTQEAGSGQGIDSGNASVASADPEEEGGEADPAEEIKRVRRDSPVDEERR